MNTFVYIDADSINEKGDYVTKFIDILSRIVGQDIVSIKVIGYLNEVFHREIKIIFKDFNVVYLYNREGFAVTNRSLTLEVLRDFIDNMNEESKVVVISGKFEDVISCKDISRIVDKYGWRFEQKILQ